MNLLNPFLPWRVSGGWTAAHQAIDYATPVGTPFGSPDDGVYRHVGREMAWAPGQAGIYGDLVRTDGSRIRFCHLESHVAAHGARVKRGQILGRTGNTGYVIPRPSKAIPHNGAHMHTTGFHADGRRWNWTLDAGADAPASNPTPAPAPIILPVLNGDPTMPWLIHDQLRKMWFLVVPQGSNKPRAVRLDATGYRVPPGVNDSSYAKLAVVGVTEQWALDQMRTAVDGL